MAKKTSFDKFINKPVKGAKIKEAFKQEKKAAIRERRAAIENHFEEKRRLKAESPNQTQGSNENRSVKGEKKFTQKKAIPYKTTATGKPPLKKLFAPKKEKVLPIKAISKKENDGPSAPQKTEKKSGPTLEQSKPMADKIALQQQKNKAAYSQKSTASNQEAAPGGQLKPSATNNMPLNKFLAHAGLCSRRDAVDVVKKGTVTVNGVVVTEPAFKVADTDVVKVEGKPIKRIRNQVYILLNKPKDTITTAEDPQGRKTVMDIIKNATTERVFPVGRLDRNTSGVLLLTNDGDLAQHLSHPSFEVRKIYEVKLDKVLQKDDFEKIISGIMLEDGEVHADSLAYSQKDKATVGIEIHSGRNRIVRRIFEQLGYDVRGLDRVMYANLTKKNVERGKWRFLTEKEVRLLKYFNKSKQEKT